MQLEKLFIYYTNCFKILQRSINFALNPSRTYIGSGKHIIPIITLTLLLIVGTICINPPSLYAQAIIPAQQTQPEQPLAEQGLAQINHFLQKQLETSSQDISFLVILKEQPNVEKVLVNAQLKGQIGAASRAARATALYNSLTSDAMKKQQSVRALLDLKNASYTQFYIVNMIEVLGDLELVNQLRHHPDVDRLIANPWVRGQLMVEDMSVATGTTSARYIHKSWSWLTELEIPEKDQPFAQPEMTVSAANLAQPYGLSFTGAPNVWAQGYTGQGIVVASQDTGIEWDHPALKEKYRGWNAGLGTVTHTNQWYDPWDNGGRPTACEDDAQVPCDDHGHGTHTVGTMLGDTGIGGTVIGMAPDAQWIGCRNMINGTGTIGSYTACFEFFLAPYPQGGNKMTDGNPALAPHVINNSWSCPPEEGCDPDSLLQVVETVRAAGIMVVGAAGNEGNSSSNSCSTVKNPIAIYDSTFSIGAHNSNGEITNFSSRGPVTIDGSGRAKPDLSAPGYAVESAVPLYKNANGYSTSSGTSMASPHVAGAAALIWSAAPQLIGEVDLTEEILIKSATPVPSNMCGEGPSPISPNYTYGFGRLNVEAAVAMAQKPASASVTLLNCDGAALPDALVTLTDGYTGYQYSARTNGVGVASIPYIYASSAGNNIFMLEATAGMANILPSAKTLAAGGSLIETIQVTSSCAQPLPLEIFVEKGDDGTAIPLAIIKLTSVDTGLLYSAQTDANGNATLPNMYQGAYEAEIDAVGYTFEDTMITIASVGTTTMPPQIFTSIVKSNQQAFMPMIFQ